MEFTLGTKVKDKVTKLKGIAVSRIVYLNGCVQFGVAPPVDDDGKVRDTQYIDVGQLEFVSSGIVEDIHPRPTGGPQRHAPSN